MAARYEPPVVARRARIDDALIGAVLLSDPGLPSAAFGPPPEG